MVENLFCFISVLGRGDCRGHSAPIAQVIGLTTRICHEALEITDFPHSGCFQAQLCGGRLDASPPHPMTEVRRKKGHLHQRRNTNAYTHILQVMYDTDVALALMVCALTTLVLFPTQEVVAALVEVSANCRTRQRTS